MKSVYKSNDVNWNSMPVGGRRYMGLSPLLFIHLPAFGGWRWRKPGSSRISWKVLRSSPPIPGVSLDQPRCKASLLLGLCEGLPLSVSSITEECILHRTSTPRDFVDGPVVNILPCNVGDQGSIPGWGTKIPHASGN